MKKNSCHSFFKYTKAVVMLAAFVFSAKTLAVDYDGKEAPKVATEVPAAIQDVGITPQLGTKLDLNLTFTDDQGEKVQLAKYINGKKPVIISLIYFSCPGLCNFHLNGLTDAMKMMEWTVGNQFDVIAISFDPKEGADVALKKKENYIKEYGRSESRNGWHFLTADQQTIDQITKATGFKYKWDDKEQQWAHASAAMVASPTGMLSRYLPGIQFEPRDVKFALTEASDGKIGTLVDQLVLYCFKYDPHENKYSLYAFNLVRLGGIIMVIGLIIWLLPAWIRARKE